MAPAGGSPDSCVLPQEGVGGDGLLESGGKPEPHGKHRRHRLWIIVLALQSLALFIAVIVLAVQKNKCPSAGLPAGPACPDSWIGYQGKCYYFSGDERDWASSQTHCSAFNASLAEIDTKQDMNFTVHHKGRYEHWIGLWRDPGQPWKWASGTKFNNWFSIGGEEGDCVYLDDQGNVRSLQCTSMRYWICAKPDAFTEMKRTHHASIAV